MAVAPAKIIDLASVRFHQLIDNAQQGALAGAARTNNTVNFTPVEDQPLYV